MLKKINIVIFLILLIFVWGDLLGFDIDDYNPFNENSIYVIDDIERDTIDVKYEIIGLASYYGKGFHGRMTANGEIFNKYELTAAHKTLPFNTKVRVTNLDNNKSIIVRINDRGPFIGKRIIDMSEHSAEKIDMIQKGVVKVKVEILN